MKLVELKCKNCGSLLNVEEGAKNVTCEYCHTSFVIDDEVQHVQHDNMYESGYELKATHITNKEKGKLLRSLNAYYKFAVVIKQKSLNAHIFDYKKSKQRYLDYSYKIGLKRKLEQLKKSKLLPLDDLGTLHIFADEHTTATDGRYELQEALLQEYKLGTFNMSWNSYFPPILPQLVGVETKKKSHQSCSITFRMRSV